MINNVNAGLTPHGKITIKGEGMELSSADVFLFMQTSQDVAVENETAVQALLDRVVSYVERRLNRKVVDTTLDGYVFYDGKTCRVIGDTIYLDGPLQDLHIVTEFVECGVTLVESVAYDDGGDFVFNAQNGTVLKVNGTWSHAINAFKVTGSCGLVGGDLDTTGDLKQYIIEMTAAKSGLWTKQMEADDGTMTQYTITTISKETEKLIAQYEGGRQVGI